jgi:hypothetical protein
MGGSLSSVTRGRSATQKKSTEEPKEGPRTSSEEPKESEGTSIEEPNESE